MTATLSIAGLFVSFGRMVSASGAPAAFTFIVSNPTPPGPMGVEWTTSQSAVSFWSDPTHAADKPWSRGLQRWDSRGGSFADKDTARARIHRANFAPG